MKSRGHGYNARHDEIRDNVARIERDFQRYQGRRGHFATITDFECGKSDCRQTCRAGAGTVTAAWAVGVPPSARTCHRSVILPALTHQTLRWQFETSFVTPCPHDIPHASLLRLPTSGSHARVTHSKLV